MQYNTALHYSILLYYTILYYTILYYTILYYTILYYTILYYTILYYYTLFCRQLCYIVLGYVTTLQGVQHCFVCQDFASCGLTSCWLAVCICECVSVHRYINCIYRDAPSRFFTHFLLADVQLFASSTTKAKEMSFRASPGSPGLDARRLPRHRRPWSHGSSVSPARCTDQLPSLM